MATALDLLMSAKEDVNLYSEESDICTIDAKTRVIFVPSTIVVGGVQSDKNAERIKFSCPKIVGDNLDLSKFSVRINFENVSSVDFNVSIKDQYICDDVAVDGENVTFSWLIGRNAARYMGTVRFIVCAVKTDSDSNISVEWNTAIAEVPVLEGIEIDQPQIGQEEKDVINQLLELAKNTSAEAVQNVNSAKEQAIKDIQSVSQPDTTLTIEGGLAEAKATGKAIGSLKEDIVNLEEIDKSVNLLNINDNEVIKNKYMTTSGVLDESDTYSVSGFIPVKPNTKYKVVINEPPYGNSGTTARFVTAFNKSKEVLPNDGGNDVGNSGFTTSSNTYFVRLTLYNPLSKVVVFTEYTNTPPYDDYYYHVNPKGYKELQNLKSSLGIKNKNITIKGSLSENNKIETYAPDVMNSKYISFNCVFDNFGKIQMGHGDDDYIEIDNTEVNVYHVGTKLVNEQHNLTISENLQVKLDVDKHENVKITIQSLGNSFNLESYNWFGYAGTLFAKSIQGNYTNCVLSWSCDGYNKPIQLYGDSYFSCVDSSRWTTHLLKDGYANNLIDAYPGRDSQSAYNSLLENIKHCTPKTIIWCLGMNNGDTETINTNWLTIINLLTVLCKDYNIELILSTIPNTPNVKNTLKNNYVINSGYRYIDFASAVNANEEGATWYEGMLSADKVHPTELGAKTLYMRAIADVPELMNQ